MSSPKRDTAVGAAEVEKAGYVRLVDEELCQIVGCQKILLESELTKADLLEFLKAKGFIRAVKGIVEVTVQTLSGDSFGVTLEEGGTIADLKSEIEGAQGAALYRQELFMLGEGMEGGNEVRDPLPNDHEIVGSCTVMLFVQLQAVWSWDASSPLLERKVFELRGPNNSTAAKAGQDDDWENCLMTLPVMEADTGKHVMSMLIEIEVHSHGLEGLVEILCGVVSDGAACDEDHGVWEGKIGWFMSNYDGALYGNEKKGDDAAGEINSGDVLTMQVDMDAGTLKFWVNGKPHGPGYTSGVRGPLRWAISQGYIGGSVVILPTPVALQPPPPSPSQN